MAGKLIISKQLEKAVGLGYIPITDATGCQQYSLFTTELNAAWQIQITDGVTTENINNGNTITFSSADNATSVVVSAVDTVTIGTVLSATAGNDLTIDGTGLFLDVCASVVGCDLLTFTGDGVNPFTVQAGDTIDITTPDTYGFLSVDTSVADTIAIDIFGDPPDGVGNQYIVWNDTTNVYEFQPVAAGFANFIISDDEAVPNTQIINSGDTVTFVDGNAASTTIISAVDTVTTTVNVSATAGNDITIDGTGLFLDVCASLVGCTLFTVTDGTNPFTIIGGDTLTIQSVDTYGLLTVDTSVADTVSLDIFAEPTDGVGNQYLCWDDTTNTYQWVTAIAGSWNLSDGVTTSTIVDAETVLVEDGDGIVITVTDTAPGATLTIAHERITECFDVTSASIPNNQVTVAGVLPTDLDLIDVYRNGAWQRIGAGNDFTLAGNVLTFSETFGGSTNGTDAECICVRYDTGA